jgi:hypothetical protein
MPMPEQITIYAQSARDVREVVALILASVLFSSVGALLIIAVG